MKELTDNQKGVLEVLRRRGAEFTASATERHWRKGESYYLDDRNAAAEGIRRKFAQGNNEVELPKGHRPAVPDLLEALREAADGMGGSFAIWEGVAVEIFDAKDAAQGDNKDARLARTYAYDIDCKPAITA